MLLDRVKPSFEGAGLVRVWPFVVALALGCFMAQGLAPQNWAIAMPAGVIGSAVLLLRAHRVKTAWWIGWIFGTGYFATGLSWIVEPFQVDPEAHAWMAPFALVFLGGGLALFWGAAFALAQRCARGDWRVLALVGFWGVLEFGRAYLLTGFPWAALAQLSVSDVTLALLPWIGPHGVATVYLLIFLPVALLLRRPALALAPVTGAIAIGTVFLPKLPPAEAVALTSHTVRLVQPNAPQDEKWLPEKRWEFVRRQVGFSSAEPRPDLIVWPETAVPQLLEYAEDTLGVISSAAHGVPIMMGIQRRKNGSYFNSAVLVDENGRVGQTYDKVHLVPFGEYMPLRDLVARFGIYGLAARAGAGYSPGAERGLMDTPVGRLLPLICYEGVFADEIRPGKPRPDFLTLITNDAWFGTYSGPQQHLVQAQMRAAEQGLPMVRVANTGVSAMIDPYGRIRPEARIDLGEAGYVDAILPQPLAVTLYGRTGDWPVFLLICLFVAISAGLGRKKPRGAHL